MFDQKPENENRRYHPEEDEKPPEPEIKEQRPQPEEAPALKTRRGFDLSWVVVFSLLSLSLAVGFVLLHRKPAPDPTPPASKPPVAKKRDLISIPKSLGGTLDSASLAKLLNEAHQEDLNNGRLSLTLRGRKHQPPNLPIGERIDVRISSSKDCYFLLAHRDSDGTFEVLGPKSSDGAPSGEKLKAGIVEEGPAYATPPGGQQEFVLICAESAVNLEQLLAGPPETYKRFISVVTFPYIALKQ